MSDWGHEQYIRDWLKDARLPQWGKALMVGKRVQFDEETWQAIEAVADNTGKAFQELADEAFADLLKKRKQPVGLKAALKESVGEPARSRKR